MKLSRRSMRLCVLNPTPALTAIKLRSYALYFNNVEIRLILLSVIQTYKILINNTKPLT
jgi:hypothetical protein